VETSRLLGRNFSQIIDSTLLDETKFEQHEADFSDGFYLFSASVSLTGLV
jgi:hypothetical protein